MTKMNSYDDLGPAIERAVRARLRDHPLVEDAVQEAHIDAWRRRGMDPDLPFGHLLVSARSRALDVAIGKQAFGAPPRSPGSGSRKVETTSLHGDYNALVRSDYEAQIGHQESLTRQVVEAILGEEDLIIVNMMVDGYHHADIALELGRSVGWVRARMPKIREQLRPHLEDIFY